MQLHEWMRDPASERDALRRRDHEVRVGRCQRFEQQKDLGVFECLQTVRNGIGGEFVPLLAAHPFREIALHRRAEYEEIATEVGGGAGQIRQVLAT